MPRCAGSWRRRSGADSPLPNGRGAGGEGTRAMVSEPHRFARSLRKASTPAEDTLWTRLRASRFHGAKFKRQVPIDRYIVDFCCQSARLIVEIDGVQHEWQSPYDEIAQRRWKVRASRSCASRTRKCERISSAYCSGYAARCAFPSIDPLPRPLSRTGEGRYSLATPHNWRKAGLVFASAGARGS